MADTVGHPFANPQSSDGGAGAGKLIEGLGESADWLGLVRGGFGGRDHGDVILGQALVDAALRPTDRQALE